MFGNYESFSATHTIQQIRQMSLSGVDTHGNHGWLQCRPEYTDQIDTERFRVQRGTLILAGGWTSDDFRYRGCGTAGLDKEDGWRIPRRGGGCITLRAMLPSKE